MTESLSFGEEGFAAPDVLFCSLRFRCVHGVAYELQEIASDASLEGNSREISDLGVGVERLATSCCRVNPSSLSEVSAAAPVPCIFRTANSYPIRF
jgi:hypothetical protein